MAVIPVCTSLQDHPDEINTGVVVVALPPSPSHVKEMDLLYHILALTSMTDVEIFTPSSSPTSKNYCSNDNKQATHQQAQFSRRAAPWHVPETLGVTIELHLG
jgi:hypothetical protein